MNAATICLLALHLLAAGDKPPTAALKPLIVTPDKIVLQEDFSAPKELDKKVWTMRQGTRWAIEEGVLRGRPSTAEFQASKKDHKGVEPRLSVPATPAEFAIAFSVRFSGGEPTAIVPFVEFGHHVCRVRFAKEGLTLLGEGEAKVLAETKSLKYEPGRWYHALAELKGDEFVIQFVDGPTLRARHAAFAQPATKGGNGLGIAGPRDGLVEVDDLTIWSVKAAPKAL